MFKREIKVGFKNFIIWCVVLISLFLMVHLIYPTVINEDMVNQIDEMIKMFPPEMIKAFNMDMASLTSVFGWIKTEGIILLILITGIYSSIMGSNIILKEENDKTIEYLNSLPVSRTKIFFNKYFAGFMYIVLLVLCIGLFNFIGLKLGENFNVKQFLLLSISPLFTSLTIYSLSIMLSTFFNKTKKLSIIGIGIVFVSYFIKVLSDVSSEVEWLKYFSIFTLADVRNIIKNVSISPVILFITIILMVIFTGIGLINYNKKEFI